MDYKLNKDQFDCVLNYLLEIPSKFSYNLLKFLFEIKDNADNNIAVDDKKSVSEPVKND